MAEPAVRIAGLNHFYGRGSLRKQILFDIETVISEGEIIIATGPPVQGRPRCSRSSARCVHPGGAPRGARRTLTGAPKRKLENVRKRIGHLPAAQSSRRSHSHRERRAGSRGGPRHRGAALRARATEMLEAIDGRAFVSSPGAALPGSVSGWLSPALGQAVVLATNPASLDKASGREVVDRMPAKAASMARRSLWSPMTIGSSTSLTNHPSRGWTAVGASPTRCWRTINT